MGWGTHEEVRDGLGDQLRGFERVGGPTGRSGKGGGNSGRSGSGRGTLREFRDGSGDPRGGPGRVG